MHAPYLQVALTPCATTLRRHPLPFGRTGTQGPPCNNTTTITPARSCTASYILQVAAYTNIMRVYHGSACLALDGSIVVAGADTSVPIVAETASSDAAGAGRPESAESVPQLV